MSDTYETYIAPTFPRHRERRPQELLAPPGVKAVAFFQEFGGVAVVISKDEEQPQVPAPQTVQEEADEDVPLDFELTEACFRGLPPLVDAGKEQIKERARSWEDTIWGNAYTRADLPVISADAEGAPIAGTVEDAKVFFDALDARLAELAESPPKIATDNLLPGVDEPVESWAAEAEAKRWRGDIDHILRSCNICGVRTVFGESVCTACIPLFLSFWRGVGGAWSTSEESHRGLPVWDAAVRKHPGYVPGGRLRLGRRSALRRARPEGLAVHGE